VHASGFGSPSTASLPEEAARVFLAVHGPAFGVTARQALVLETAPAPGDVGAVRFRRTIDGLPVFGANLVIGVDAAGSVFLVNGADVPDGFLGRHVLGAESARSAAMSAFPGGIEGAGVASVAAGWRTFGPAVRPVYRVDFIASKPAGDWRVFVDAESGATLFREDRRSYTTAHGTVFEVSPVETAAAFCPVSGGGRGLCATPVGVTFPNLVDGTSLSGTQTAVFNCKGGNAPTAATGVPGSCSAVAPVASGFDFLVDTNFTSTSDDFAAAMAYYHLDRHITFFKTLDPTLPPATGGAAIRSTVPALVNVQQNGGPFENAFYSPSLDAMVFGQGATADFAYDATIAYHEFTHGVISAWGNFGLAIDSLGGVSEPGAVNEGSADTMAAAETGRSQIGDFIGATDPTPSPFLRDMNDPNVLRTCRGDGTRTGQLGSSSTINGLDGEVHDDGEIWNGLSWEVFNGLRSGGIKGCGGACEAGAALQYKAIQLSGGTSPTLNTYWQTLKSAATALFPANPQVAAYVDCVGKRRRFDQCDRTVPVYLGESKVQFVNLRYGHFQNVVTTTAPSTTLSVCSADNGATTKAHVRKGAPVELLTLDSRTLNATFAEDFVVTPISKCLAARTPVTLPTVGTWYVLFESPDALAGGSPGFERYLLAAPTSGVATRPAAVAPAVCRPPTNLAISVPAATVAPGGQLNLSATGGSGSGYTWSFGSNASGGSIGASTGAYTAGATGRVNDVINVSDSAGNTATTSIAVSAPPAPPVQSGGGGCASGPDGIVALLGVAAMLLRRRSGAR
jgi:Zn-dependent metalloprotease